MGVNARHTILDDTLLASSLALDAFSVTSRHDALRRLASAVLLPAQDGTWRERIDVL